MLVLLGILFGPAARAEEAWTPDEPDLAGWDWLQLDTGEWLKGELISFQDDVAEFDSDKFDELDIDIEDVIVLRLSAPRIFRRVGRQTYEGTGELRDRTVYIRTGEGETVEFPDRELVSIVYTHDSEINNWYTRIGASFDTRSGNTDQQDFTGNALVRRDSPFLRWTNRYKGTLTRVDGSKTADNHRVTSELDLLVTQHFFVRLPYFEFFKDEFQNIAARYTPGLGVGYELIDTRRVEFVVTGGGAAQATEFEEGGRDLNGALLFTSELGFDLPRDVDLDFAYRLQLVPGDLDRTNHTASAIISYEFWDPLELDLGFYWDRIEGPEKENDGTTPEKDDLRFRIGVAIAF